MKKCRRRIRLLICMGVLGIFILGCLSIYGWRKGVRIEVAKENIHASSQGEHIPYVEAEGETKVIEELIVEAKKDILLVNKDNPLPQDYTVELITLPDKVNRVGKEAYEPLINMLEAGQQEGLSFEICSSYRDALLQKELFEEDVRALILEGYSYADAYAEVATHTMPPGCSEHSTGLAFDIVALDYQILDEKQGRTQESIWLRENCAKYGFILRYPEGKEEITGISYESWHFRYVGVEAAQYIMENGITLEEYLDPDK